MAVDGAFGLWVISLPERALERALGGITDDLDVARSVQEARSRHHDWLASNDGWGVRRDHVPRSLDTRGDMHRKAVDGSSDSQSRRGQRAEHGSQTGPSALGAVHQEPVPTGHHRRDALTANGILRLQRKAGNGAVRSLQASNRVSPTSRIQRDPKDEKTEVYEILYKGRRYRVPKDEYPAFSRKLLRITRKAIGPRLDAATDKAVNLYTAAANAKERSPITGWALEQITGAPDLPDKAIFDKAVKYNRLAQASLRGSDVMQAVVDVNNAEPAINEATAAIDHYWNDHIAMGGQKTLYYLQLTKFTAFVVLSAVGGKVLVAAGRGAAAAGALSSGGSALLDSASSSVVAKVVAGDEVTSKDLQTVLLSTLLASLSGGLGGQLNPYISKGVINRLPASLASKPAAESVVKELVDSGSSVVRAAITDSVEAAAGTGMTVDQFVTRVVNRLIAEGIVGLVASKLGPR